MNNDFIRCLLSLTVAFLLFLPVPGEETKKQLSGYTQFLSSSWKEGTASFLIRRSRLGLDSDILKGLRFRLLLDVGKSPALLDAIIDYDLFPNLQLRLGQFKVPFSPESLTSASSLDIINRSQTVEKLSPGRDIGSQGRDIGITLNGKSSFLEWTLGVFNGSGINRKDANSSKDLGARAVFHPHQSLAIGASFYRGNDPSPQLERERIGLDILLLRLPFTLKSELIIGRDDETEKLGFYLQGGYFFLPGKLQAILKFDTYDSNMELTGDRVDIITLGLNLFFSQKTKLQANAEIHRESPGSANFGFHVLFQIGF